MTLSLKHPVVSILPAFVTLLFIILMAVPKDVSAHVEVDLAQLGLREGDLVRATGGGDPDIYIVNEHGYKRLFLNPAIFSFYGHLKWENVKEISREFLDIMPTSGLFRNCETNDYKAYAVEVIAEDDAVLHWVNVTAGQALAEDHDLFKKVFCINTREFTWYARAAEYASLTQIPVYTRSTLPPAAINETNMPLALPDGFEISLFTPEPIGKLRFMAFSPDGILFVSLPSSVGLYGDGSATKNDGKIFALPDANNDGRADETKTILSGLDLPHGIAFHNGYLYVSEEGRIVRYPYQGNAAIAAPEVIVNDLPTGGEHLSRTLGFSPSGKMYVSVGSSCNVCEEQDERFAAVLEYNSDGTGGRVFARGLRNAVGFVFHPMTGEMWATENGRDWLGDDLPPDEINIVRDGKDHGWPFCYGKNIHDTDFDKNFYIAIYPPLPCGTGDAPIKEPSLFDLQAHSAPLGLRFITGAQFPQAWQGDLLVALHGSWNRTVPVGYSVVKLDVEGNTIVGVHDFITGWLRPDGSKLGRPVDLIFDANGALYISDDKANVIYRLVKQ